jgi:hypothetical protein
VMPITIAALITPRWLARRLEVPEGVTQIVVPGFCQGDLTMVEDVAKVPVERGPRDYRQLPEFFGQKTDRSDYGDWDIEIIARLPAADTLDVEEILDRAEDLTNDGADVVLLGGSSRLWPGLVDVVRELRGEGRRVAVEGVVAIEILSAVREGAELVVATEADQVEAAAAAGCEVALCGRLGDPESIAETVEPLLRGNLPFRVDLGLNPIGLGLADCLGRFLDARRRRPDVRLMMSLDTVTETTAVDSSPLHILLMGLCQELGVGSVVVGQSSNWTRSAVRECHLARQLTHHVARKNRPASDVEPGLLLARDLAALEFGRENLDRLAETLKDPSPRIYAEEGRLHAVSAGRHDESDDPYDLFDQITAGRARPIEAAEAFYLGYETAKAVTALTLGKTYRQDEALDWGLQTDRELTRLERRALRMARARGDDCDEAAQYFEEDDSDESSEESRP